MLLDPATCETASPTAEVMSCPPGCVDSVQDPKVWGTLVYTQNSQICLAAIHAGVISSEYACVISSEYNNLNRFPTTPP